MNCFEPITKSKPSAFPPSNSTPSTKPVKSKFTVSEFLIASSTSSWTTYFSTRLFWTSFKSFAEGSYLSSLTPTFLESMLVLTTGNVTKSNSISTPLSSIFITSIELGFRS